MSESKRKNFEFDFAEKIKNNEDSDGEPIFSMPKISPLLKANDGSYYTLLTNSFSIGKNFQTKFAEMIDKPKWNEITLMAQIHETIASKVGAIRSFDVRKRIITNYDTNESSTNIKKCIKFFTNHSKNKNYDQLLSPINASLFFTLLFIDKELNAKLNIDQKLVIANALTFAVWKEKMEMDILLHKELGKTFRELLHYKISKQKQKETFNYFCRGERYEDIFANTLNMLGISPWVGIDEVMLIVNDIMKSNKKYIYGGKGQADRLLREILINATHFFSNDEIYSIEKRLCEDQWFFIAVIPFLDPKLKLLTQEILHANVAVDIQGNTQRVIELIEILKDDPKVKAEMQKVSGDIQEYASTILTGVLSKTGEKIMQKTFDYFIFIPFMMRVFHEWKNKGLFASLQYTLEHTIRSLSGRIFMPRLA